MADDDIIAKSADGKRHRFPAGTDRAVIDRVMKRYALETTPPNKTDMTPSALEASNNAAVTETLGLLPDQGTGNAVLDQVLQGSSLNLGDEAAGGIAAVANLLGLDKRFSGPTEAYRGARDIGRRIMKSHETFHPVASDVGNIGGQVGTSILTGAASGARNLLSLMGLGGAEGAASNIGASESEDPIELAKTGAMGAVAGATGAGLFGGLPLAAGRLTPKGLAYDAINAATDGDIPTLVAKMRAKGGSAAESDEVMRTVLHGQAQKNATAATKALPAARSRLATVNAEVQNSVNRIISPDNAQLLLKKLKEDAQTFAKANYGVAYSNGGTVGLMPDLTFNPGMQPAITAAKNLAEMEGRTFDVTALTIKDLDAMQRALKGEAEKLFKEGGSETIFGPVKSSMREDVNNLAKAMSQEYADVQARYAQNIKQREAVKLGAQALNTNKEAAEIAAEYVALSAPEQEAYRAAVATKARALLAAKRPNANASAVLSPEGVIEKLKAVGFPEEELQALIERGSAARGVVDALQGGSDTARNLAAKEATQSVLTNIKPTTLLAGAVVNPITIPLLPAIRELGLKTERSAAAKLIDALLSPDPRKLQSLMRTAPQAFIPPAGMVGAPLATGFTQER